MVKQKTKNLINNDNISISVSNKSSKNVDKILGYIYSIYPNPNVKTHIFLIDNKHFLILEW